jgi:uncharacterized protein YegP (UPF0339 family)
MQFEIYNEPRAEHISVPEWRWRLIKIVGNVVIANSAESFKSKLDCEANIHLVMLTDYSTPILQRAEEVKSGLVKGLIPTLKLINRQSG